MASSSQTTQANYEKSIVTGSFFKPELYLAFCDNDDRAQRLVDCCTNLGLMTFLNPPIDGICYENLISFWKNARFVPSTKKTEVDRIISNVCGKEVIVTPGVLHRYLNLPKIGTHDVKMVEVDIKKFWAEIAKNPRKTSKTFNLPRAVLKLPFAEFAPVITKNIEGRKGSMENLTDVRIKLMAIIYEGVNFDWATFVFNRLKDQIEKEADLSRAAPGKGMQKKGDFWEKKSYGFPLQLLFNALKIQPTNLQTPHKSKVMFTGIKASMKPKITIGRKRKQPEASNVGISSRTRSRCIDTTPSSQQTPSEVISVGTESDEEEVHNEEKAQKEEQTQEDPVYLEEGEEGYRITSSDEEDLSAQIDNYYPEEDQEKEEPSDDELTLQEVLSRNLSKVDTQPGEQDEPAHLPDPVNTPIIAQGGICMEEELHLEKDKEEMTKDEEENKKKEEELAVEKEEREAEKGEGADAECSNEDSKSADDEMPPQEFDLEENFNLDTQPLLAHMERQHSSRKHLKRVLSSDIASKEHKFKALYDHLKIQDATIDHQSQLLCNLGFLVPHLVESAMYFHTDKIDHNFRPLVNTLNDHTSQIANLGKFVERSSNELNLLLRLGAATNKILERKHGPLPDVENIQEELEAFFANAKKGEEEVSKKEKPEEPSKKDKGKGIWIEEPKK